VTSLVLVPVPNHVLLHLDDNVINALGFTLVLVGEYFRARFSDNGNEQVEHDEHLDDR
jgi:hypothetical protein